MRSGRPPGWEQREHRQPSGTCCWRSIHRPLRLSARQGGAAWLDFDELCSADFLWFSQEFERLIVIGTTPLDGEAIDVQQRFLNFIDILYDSAVELVLVADVGLDQLLSAGAHMDFARTHSRLQQLMQSPATFS